MTPRAMELQEAAQRIMEQKPLFILDVRNPSDFKEWKLEGKGFTYLNVPYFELLDGVEDIVDRLPADQEVLVVCAKEGSSVMVADMLVEQGRKAAYLKGGMKAWSEHLVPVKIGALKGGGELYQFLRYGKGCLSYMAMSGNEGIVVDASRMTSLYIDFAAERGIQITHVIDTHLHADHISGGRRLAQETGASYWLPEEDAQEVTFAYHALTDGTVLPLGMQGTQVEAVYSPGHTIGSTSLIVDERYLLTGDILFIDSIGRPDLAGQAREWAQHLRSTLYERYQELAEALIVLPAHYMNVDELNEDGTVARSLGQLYRENHGLNLKDSDEFMSLVSQNLPPQPNSYEEIRQRNMGRLDAAPDREREMEIGPNRCAVRS
ncbi:MBL fold metallo-hydrolase [Paenibacillus sp. F411]|uniref:MBL fold metallo-hydrolase n=1 Tax=Paenibacillus sp. F411 TaxID=2820239 RepID=UPI001AAE7D38|nr:MBL fold metallo-hydrolase [Paenibacillus sp. F411]